MLRVLGAAPMAIVVALMVSGGALANPTPRPCSTVVCGAPAPDLGTGAPAILAVVLSFGVATWMAARAKRAAQQRD
jgi:hypothetical protein